MFIVKISNWYKVELRQLSGPSTVPVGVELRQLYSPSTEYRVCVWGRGVYPWGYTGSTTSKRQTKVVIQPLFWGGGVYTEYTESSTSKYLSSPSTGSGGGGYAGSTTSKRQKGKLIKVIQPPPPHSVFRYTGCTVD